MKGMNPCPRTRNSIWKNMDSTYVMILMGDLVTCVLRILGPLIKKMFSGPSNCNRCKFIRNNN